MKGSSMKKEYNLKKLNKRPGKIKVDSEAAKTPISIRLDGVILAALKTEAERLGIPYQTLVSSVLHRFVQGELVDKKSLDLAKLIKSVS
jgi:predicted DNA binding CopG/RHH family protein